MSMAPIGACGDPGGTESADPERSCAGGQPVRHRAEEARNGELTAPGGALAYSRVKIPTDNEQGPVCERRVPPAGHAAQVEAGESKQRRVVP
jgi:hypothetical protein